MKISTHTLAVKHTLLLTGALCISTSVLSSPWQDPLTNQYFDQDLVIDIIGDANPDRILAFPNYDGWRGMVAILEGTGDPRDVTYYRSSPPNGAPYTREQLMDSNLGGLPGVTSGMAGSLRIDLDVVGDQTGLNHWPWTHLGSSMATGDLNGDGFQDLVIGIPGADIPTPSDPQGDILNPDNQVNYIINAGMVLVFYGSDLRAGIIDAEVWTANTPGVNGVAETSDRFGEVVHAGDVNCDGFADLIVGSPREDVGNRVDAGIVQVLYGSQAGVTANGDDLFYQGYNGVSGTAESGDRLGAALTTGHFNDSEFQGRECLSLAIGAPGEGVIRNGVNQADAGQVHVLYAYDYGSTSRSGVDIGLGGEGVFTQDTAGIDSYTESNDHFGASLGKVQGVQRLGQPRMDSLWIGVPGESWLSACPETGTTQVLGVTSSGINPYSDKMLCTSVRPDIKAAEPGLVVEKSDQYGRWLQYIPEGLDVSKAQLLVVAHGTSNAAWAFDAREYDTFTTSRGNSNFYMDYDGWITAADENDLVLIFPQFEEWNFGNTSAYTSGTDGGYRGLFGRDIAANTWIEHIVDRYKAAGVGTGQFYLMGHSAGGQFTNRYLMMGSDRLLGAVIMSPQNVTLPDLGKSWPEGFGAYDEAGDWADASWQSDQDKVAATFESTQVYYVVGSKEDGSNGPDRVGTAQNWVNAINNWMWFVRPEIYNFPVDLCIVNGGSHSSRTNHYVGLVKLFPALAAHPDFAPMLSCQ